VAILKTVNYPVDTAAVFEDPTPGSNRIYIQFDGYDRGTLAPLFGRGINYSTTGTALTGFGVSYNRSDASFNGGRMLKLALTGPVTEVQTTSTVNNTSRNNIDPAPFLSMDTTRPIRRVRYDTSGSNSNLGMFMPKITNNDSGRQFNNMGAGSDTFYTGTCNWLNPSSVETTLPYQNRNWSADGANVPTRFGAAFYPVYFNSATGNMVVCAFAGRDTSPGAFDSNSGEQHAPSNNYGARFTNYMTPSSTLSANSSGALGGTNQFIGVDSGGRALFFHNNVTTDYNHQVIRYNDADNTGTVLFNNTAVPAAGGTSAGGNRGTNFGQSLAKYCSATFADPTSAGNVCWYTPYCDVNGKFHPLWFQWNRAADTFVRNENITVNWASGLNQDNIWQADTVSASSASTWYGMQRLWLNDTWTVTNGGTTTRYLMLMQLHGSGTVYDSLPKQRTFVVFTVDAANPRTLTYHSSIIIPSTPKNIIWFNDSRTQLGVFSDNNFYTYSFTQGAGWTLTGTLPYRFSSVGIDGLGRIWALATGAAGYAEIHMLTVNVPVTITVTAPQSSYNFTGTNISTSITVNAYDPSGARIAVVLKLVVDGGSMTFSGSNLTTTVTTSASANTVVPVTITGAGISNVIASVVL
jgi:hypothetical protein